MTDSATILRYVRDIKAGWATAPTDFPDKIMPYLLGLYEGQQHGNAEQVWNGKVRKGLAREFPDLTLGAWADIQAARKYIFTEPEFHKLHEEPPALLTADGKTLLIGEGQVLVYAPTRSFKSFIALHWAKYLANDGKRVLFCVGERFKAFAKRSRAYNSYYECPPTGNLEFADVLALHMDGLGIGAVGNVTPPYDVVFVDTFRSVIDPEDENSNSEIGKWLRELRKLAKLVVIIHHTNKGGEDFAGAGAFSTNTDVEIKVKVVKGVKLMRRVEVDQNDDDSDFDLHYRLVIHDGSLVAVEADGDAVMAAKARAAAQSEEAKNADNDPVWTSIIAEVAGEDGWSSRADIIEASIAGKPTVERRLKSMYMRYVIEKERRGKQTYYRKVMEVKDEES